MIHFLSSDESSFITGQIISLMEVLMKNFSQLGLLESRSLKLRDICLQIGKEGGENAAHIGGALSCIDFIVGADHIFNFSSPQTDYNL